MHRIPCRRPSKFNVITVSVTDSPKSVALAYRIDLADLYYYNPWLLENPDAWTLGAKVHVPEYQNVITQRQP